MACGGCKRKAEGSSPASLSRGIGPDAGLPAGMVEVHYRGTVGNHFVYSPTQRVNGQRLRYGYFSRGDLIVVHAEDVAARPDLFVPVVSVQPEAMGRAVAAWVEPVETAPVAVDAPVPYAAEWEKAMERTVDAPAAAAPKKRAARVKRA